MAVQQPDPDGTYRRPVLTEKYDVYVHDNPDGRRHIALAIHDTDGSHFDFAVCQIRPGSSDARKWLITHKDPHSTGNQYVNPPDFRDPAFKAAWDKFADHLEQIPVPE